jgi:hypothetical protein
MTEGVIRLFVDLLVKQIELDLKRLLFTHLRRRHSDQWWSALPTSAQRLAKSRYEWSRETLGSRRVVSFPDIAWLTLGEVLKTLDSMTPPEWQRCLGAETRRPRLFGDTLIPVKGFRDYHIAHPKPRDPTTSEIAALCVAARRLPAPLCPLEWERACDVVRQQREFLIPVVRSSGSKAHFEADDYCARLLKWWDANYGDWTKWKLAPNQRLHPTALGATVKRRG